MMKYQVVGLIKDQRLKEISGIAASWQNPDILWVHNDSGDSARFFGINKYTREVVVEVVVNGAKNIDWEAIGLGFTTDGTPVLYIADVGDNGLSRKEVQIYQIIEPVVKGLRSKTIYVSPREIFHITYPDGKHDCEALIVDPSVHGGSYWLIEKLRQDTGKGGIYRLPYGQDGVASKVGDVRVWVTDATLSHDGDTLIIRSGNAGSRYTGWKKRRQDARYDFKFPVQQQGEGVTYSRSGSGLYIATEGLNSTLIRAEASTV